MFVDRSSLVRRPIEVEGGLAGPRLLLGLDLDLLGGLGAGHRVLEAGHTLLCWGRILLALLGELQRNISITISMTISASKNSIRSKSEGS